MKLRIYGSSLRFRLSPADVAMLDKRGMIAEKTEFGGGAVFSYSLCTRTDIGMIRAILDANTICVDLPRAVVHDWSRGDEVGLRHIQAIGDGKTLDILIEKDFECLEGEVEQPGVELYPNPKKSCAASEGEMSEAPARR